MKMFYYGLTQGLSETFRGDQREKGIPVIGHEQPAIQVDPVDMADPLDVAAEQPFKLAWFHVRIPVKGGQLLIINETCG
jgi:hypothetical protein